MDPANEHLPYEAKVDISDLVSAEAVANDLSLGPNGSLLYAMEFLEKNIHWLEAKLKENKDKYILFDFPGQIELYTHNQCIRNIVQKLIRQGHRVCHFSNSNENNKLISTALTILSDPIFFIHFCVSLYLDYCCQFSGFSLLR